MPDAEHGHDLPEALTTAELHLLELAEEAAVASLDLDPQASLAQAKARIAREDQEAAAAVDSTARPSVRSVEHAFAQAHRLPPRSSGPASRPSPRPARMTRPAPSPVRARSRTSHRIALLVAFILAMVASGSLGYRIAANKNSAIDPPWQSAPAASPEPRPSTGTENPRASDPADPASTEYPADTRDPGDINPRAEFTTAYVEVLKVPARCVIGAYVDLDEPRVEADPRTAELAFTSCGSPTQWFEIVGTRVQGAVASSDVTPAECADLIRFSPLPDDSPVSLRRGDTFCVLTSRQAAQETASTQKMVAFTVTAIAKDGTTTLKARAWAITD